MVNLKENDFLFIQQLALTPDIFADEMLRVNSNHITQETDTRPQLCCRILHFQQPHQLH
jgi:hypothetical protein